jgi:hypothetical protein
MASLAVSNPLIGGNNTAHCPAAWTAQVAILQLCAVTAYENFRTLSEGIADIKRQTTYIPQMRQDIRELRASVDTVQAAVTDTNRELRQMREQVTEHEHRITRLEAG